MRPGKFLFAPVRSFPSDAESGLGVKTPIIFPRRGSSAPTKPPPRRGSAQVPCRPFTRNTGAGIGISALELRRGRDLDSEDEQRQGIGGGYEAVRFRFLLFL